MLVWATEFPIAHGNHCGDILGVAKGCLASSPHSAWQADSFGDDPLNDLTRHDLGGQVVNIGCVDFESAHWAGLQHQWVEKGVREWTTEIVGYETQETVLVSVRLDCNVLLPGLDLPTPKKPYFVKRLLDDLGGGRDAGLVVGDRPHRLTETDVDDATRLVQGTSGARLPVIYSSVGRFRQPLIDVDELARWVGGMAHVVVEPSRYFSFALARNVGQMNAYGGAVSIYWPSGIARQTRYLPVSFLSPAAMQAEIADRVRRALTQIRPASKCTFSHLRELVSRARIERLRSEGSTTVEQYIEAFDAELKAKDERISEVGRELTRLRAELRRHDDSADHSEGVIARGREREFYPGEVTDALIYALTHGRNSLKQGGRRAHLIDDILRVNKPTPTEEEIEVEIKDAFSVSGDLGTDQRRTLEELGFTIEEAGKHWKAAYQGDERYAFTISKTSSDHRAGKNLASTILRQLFK